MSVRDKIKRKAPATFNAVEYETNRILSAIQELMEQLGGRHTADAENAEKVRADAIRLYEEISQILQRHDAQIFDTRTQLRQSIKKLSEMVECISERCNTLESKIVSSNLFTGYDCHSDEEYDRKIVPANGILKGKGIGMAMFFSAIEEKPDPIIFETADIVRSGALSLAVDEVLRRGLTGETAELGVAHGKFARQINALLPEKKLYLFDTFDSFDENDMVYEEAHTTSRWFRENSILYKDIDIDQVLSVMRYPEKCLIKQGYFPDTAVGLDETFCLVSIDTDLYIPIYEGLKYFYPRMVQYGYIFVHDYRNCGYRGVKDAVIRFADENSISYTVLPDNVGTAIIVKQ